MTFQNKLKTLLISDPILTFLIKGKDFIVYCDASQSGLGAFLKQDRNVISYAARKFIG